MSQDSLSQDSLSQDSLSQDSLTPQQWQNRLLQLEAELRQSQAAAGSSTREKHFNILLRLAQHYYEARNYRAALARYQAALKLSPGGYEALRGEGDALRHLGQLELAIASYSQALSLIAKQSDHSIPQQAILYRNRGRAYEHLGDASAALRDYAQALRLDPSHHQLWQRRGHLLYRQERYGGALISYAQAQFREPHTAADFAMQSLFITSPGPYVKQYAEAFEDSDRRLSRSLHDGAAWQMQAQQLRQLGFEPEARASAERAVQLGFAPFPIQPPVLQA